MGAMKSYSGWAVRHPWFIRELPEALTDMIVEMRGYEANFEPHDFFTSKKEAIQKLKSYLAEHRDQAIRNLDFLSKPYISPNGILHVDRPDLLEQWRAECRARLKIAEKGLELCAGC